VKRTNILIALACLILPSLFTQIWFYSGTPQVKAGSMPNYPTIDIPKPPVSTAIPGKVPPEKPSSTIVFDMSHGNLITLSEIDPFIRSLESMGGTIQVTSDEQDLAQLLKTANAYMSLAPIQGFSANDKTVLTAFVRRGGKLVIAADPTRNMMAAEGMTAGLSGVDAANLLLEPFDAAFADDYLYDMQSNEGNYRNVIFSEFTGDDLTKGIGKLVIYGGHSVLSHGDPLTKSSGTTFSSSTDQAGNFSPFSLMKSEKGSVLAMGDLSLLTTQYSQFADNQVFIQNLAGYLTRENRVKTLDDFPRIFDGDVVLIPDKELKVDSDLLSTISKFEKAITTGSGEITIEKESGKNQNIILLSTFKSNDETKDLIEGLKINLSPEPLTTGTPTPAPNTGDKPSITPTLTKLETELTFDEFVDTATPGAQTPTEIEIPGFSVISTKNLGLVGLVHKADRTTLLIMASSPEDLKSFVEELSLTGLSGCLIKGDLAACKVTGAILEPKG
jgi:hypothetical protein